MKKIITIILLLNLTIGLNAQEKEYYDTGELKSVTTIVNGINGKSITYYKNGNIQNSAEYKEGLINGTLEEYFESGLIKSRTSYKNGEQDGLFQTFYENGNIENIGVKRKSHYVGKLKVYFENGKTNAIFNYNDLTGNREQEQLFYDEKGEVTCFWYERNENILTYYKKDLKINSEGNIANGTFYNKNNNVLAKYNFNENGNRTGEQIGYDEKGKANYFWYEDGNKIIKYSKKESKFNKDGKTIYAVLYNENDIVIAEFNFNKYGLREGEQKYYQYTKSGQKINKVWYENGKRKTEYYKKEICSGLQILLSRLKENSKVSFFEEKKWLDFDFQGLKGFGYENDTQIDSFTLDANNTKFLRGYKFLENISIQNKENEKLTREESNAFTLKQFKNIDNLLNVCPYLKEEKDVALNLPTGYKQLKCYKSNEDSTLQVIILIDYSILDQRFYIRLYVGKTM